MKRCFSKGAISGRQSQKRQASRAAKVPRSRRLFNIQSLEERLVLAWNLTLVSGATEPATANVAVATQDGTTSFTAIGTGANLKWGDVLNALSAGNDVVIDSGSTGQETGDITDLTGVQLHPLTTGNQTLTIESGTGTGLVGSITLEGVNLDGTNQSLVINAHHNVSVGFLTGGTFASQSPLASVNITAATGSVIGLTAPYAGPIEANRLAIQASSGIGSAAQPLTTQTGNLEAESDTGGVFIDNNANTPGVLNVGGVSALLHGVQATTSGDVQLTNNGSIDIFTDGDVVRGPGNVSLRATGDTADIQTGGQASGTAAIAGTGSGAVSAAAGRDVSLGDADGFGSVVSASGVLSLDAGHDVVLNANATDMAKANGALTVRANGGNLQVLFGGTVELTARLADIPALAINGAVGVANNFTLDYSGGTFTVPGGIMFNGGELPATPSNSLNILGGSFDVDTFDFQTAHDGSIQFGTNGQVVDYTNMTPLINTGTADKVVVNLPDGAVVATLDAGQIPGTVELVSGNDSFETTTFPAPGQSLTVNAGNGADTITPTAAFYGNFSGNLTVNGAANTSNVHAAEDIYVVGQGTVDVSAANGLLANDTGGTGQLSVVADSITGAEGGTFSFHADGSFSYAPASNFPGFDYATYTAKDAFGDQSTATVNVLSQTGGVVWKFYEQVLHRDPDYAGLQGWINDFLNGGTPGDIARGFFESPELLNQIITGYYLQYLGRAPQGSDLQYWEAKWGQYGGPELIIAQFAASQEFNTLANKQYGAYPDGWVTALYERILNRTPQPGDLPFWNQQLASGTTEGQVALDFVASKEAFGDDVTGWFDEYLGRAPTPTELTQYANQMLDGASDRDIEQAITNLPEYSAKPPASPPGTGVRLPDYVPQSADAKGQASLAATDTLFARLS